MIVDPAFSKRLERVVRTHQKMRRNGFVRKVGRDGLIRVRPRLVRPRFPVKGALSVVALLFAFKAVLFAQLGDEPYSQRVADLRTGNAIERAGAVILQEDPLTVQLGRFLDRTIF